MLKKVSLFLLPALVVFSVGCASARSPLSGAFYTSTQSGVAATPQAGPKWGEACASSILGIVATGDASIEAARRNGGITSIASVDEKASSILGIYATYCTIVRGK